MSDKKTWFERHCTATRTIWTLVVVPVPFRRTGHEVLVSVHESEAAGLKCLLENYDPMGEFISEAGASVPEQVQAFAEFFNSDVWVEEHAIPRRGLRRWLHRGPR